MTKKESSEFGKGLCYCLGLFLGHQEGIQRWTESWKEMKSKQPKDSDLFEENDAIGMWFYGASDHFFEIQVDSAPKHLRKRVRVLKKKCLGWRMTIGSKKPTKEDAQWALDEAKELLLLIDKYHKVPTIEAEWK